MSTLANQLAAAEREQVARAIRLLLARPLLTEGTDPAGFELVRRRREPLAQWFDYTCGWSLVVEPRRGYARLTKVRADPDGSRPARRARSGRAPFDRRRYVLLCVTAAEQLSLPMTTIGMLADRVVQATSADRALAASPVWCVSAATAVRSPTARPTTRTASGLPPTRNATSGCEPGAPDIRRRRAPARGPALRPGASCSAARAG